MSKKQVTFLCIAIVGMLAVIIFMIKKQKVENFVEIQPQQVVSSDKLFDEESGLYYIKKESTEEILYASYDENDMNFVFYKEHPEYNPDPLQDYPKTLDDFVNSYQNIELNQDEKIEY